MRRIFRSFLSFVIVLAAYGTYAVLAVPLIEPSASRMRVEGSTGTDWKDADDLTDRKINALKMHFAPGAWELDKPKIIESGQIKLLLQKYENRDDGQVKIWPCTIIFTPDEADADEAERNRRSIILQAPEGAVLRFDGPLDFRSKIGTPRAGRLLGPITIRSQGKSLGTEDDLLILTRDMNLNETRVWTDAPVRFRLGPNFGRGQEMEINLPADEASGKKGAEGPDVGGIESFIVRRLEYLHLQPKGKGIMPGDPPPGEQGSDVADVDSDLPIEIRCAGPFRFEPPRRVATFERQVAVRRIYPDGLPDQLTCDLLSIHFAHSRPAALDAATDKSDDQRPEQFDLEPRRIEALGQPVEVRSPNHQVLVRSERLEYDIYTREIRLAGSREVFLQHGLNEFHAKSLTYELVDDGRLGRVTAEGPGWLRGRQKDDSDPMQARWNHELKIRPDEGQQLLSLDGGIELSYGALGRLTADRVHLWMFELPPSEEGGRWTLQPDRMQAVRRTPTDRQSAQPIWLDSAQFSGTFDQMEVWFEPPEVAQGVPGTSEADIVVEAETDPLSRGLASDPDDPASDSHFEIIGKLLQVSVILPDDSKPAELSELTVDGGVRFTETHTRQPDERPVIGVGDRIRIDNAGQKGAEIVRLVGGPAHFEGRGLGLTGPNINVDRGTNRLWIDGPGVMDLPMDRDLEGQPLPEPGFLHVQWLQRMEFDGQTARFFKEVFATSRSESVKDGIATTRSQSVKTDRMDVSFQPRIDFANPKVGDDTAPQRLRCYGGVRMESHTIEDHVQTSYDRVELENLDVNFISGESLAYGPGSLTRHYRGSIDLPGMPGQSTVAPEEAADEDQLAYMKVTFQDKIVGNIRDREMTFFDRVEMVYGPVSSWESTLDGDDPESLGPKGFTGECDQLTVSQVIPPGQTEWANELVAVGNVLAEGNDAEGNGYVVRAPRMSYTEAKDLLILEGNGRTDARLFRQEHPGAPWDEVQGRRILYWPSTQRVSAEMRSMELNQFPE